MDREKIIEEIARAIANEIGPSYDEAYENKAAWIDDRGKRADINAPMKCDYRHAAEAALTRLEELGLVVVPREPTEAMAKAGCDMHMGSEMSSKEDERKNAMCIYRAMLGAASEGVTASPPTLSKTHP